MIVTLRADRESAGATTTSAETADENGDKTIGLLLND
jgi:hypothetical protein